MSNRYEFLYFESENNNAFATSFREIHRYILTKPKELTIILAVHGDCNGKLVLSNSVDTTAK